MASKFEGAVVEIDWNKKESVGKLDGYVKEVQKGLREILEKQKEFFSIESHTRKEDIKLEIRDIKLSILLNQLSFNKGVYIEGTPQKGGFAPTSKDIKHNTERKLKIAEFDDLLAQVKKLQADPSLPFDFFEWKLDFPEVLNELMNPNPGFDIVVGNPPYISYYGNTGSDLSDDERKYVVRLFDSVAKESDRLNSMNLFSEKGIKLLKLNGNLAFIVNKTMGVLPSYEYHRNYIINNVQFKYVITDLIPFQAIVDCLIFSIENKRPKTEYNFKFYRGDIEDYSLESISIFKKNKKIELNIPKNDGILDLIDMAPSVLSDILKINRGVNIGGCFDIFLSEKKTTAKHFKYLSGTKCIKPYFYEWAGSDGYMIFDEKKERELRSQGKTLALGNHERYLQPRLFIPESAQTIMAAYSEEQIYSAYGLLVGTTDLGSSYLKYSCALLNSKLITFYSIQCEILRKGSKATPHVGVKGLNGLPVYKDKNVIAKVAKLSDFIIYLKMQNLANPSDQLMPTYFEQIIDGMVYELYFPELIKKHKREIIQHLGELPEFTDKMSDEQKMNICKTVFNRLNDREHPVRVNLFYMSSIPEIAIIEGKNENN